MSRSLSRGESVEVGSSSSVGLGAGRFDVGQVEVDVGTVGLAGSGACGVVGRTGATGIVVAAGRVTVEVGSPDEVVSLGVVALPDVVASLDAVGEAVPVVCACVTVRTPGAGAVGPCLPAAGAAEPLADAAEPLEDAAAAPAAGVRAVVDRGAAASVDRGDDADVGETAASDGAPVAEPLVAAAPVALPVVGAACPSRACAVLDGAPPTDSSASPAPLPSTIAAEMPPTAKAAAAARPTAILRLRGGGGVASSSGSVGPSPVME